jgi:hypothetical protein
MIFKNIILLHDNIQINKIRILYDNINNYFMNNYIQTYHVEFF